MSAAKKLPMIQGEALYNGDRVQILDIITIAGRVEVLVVLDYKAVWVQMYDLVQVNWFVS